MQIESEQKPFNLTEVLNNQEFIETFVFEGVEVEYMPLTVAQEALASDLDRDDFIKYLSNWSLVSHGVRHDEKGECESFEKMWSSLKVPKGMREALALEVAKLCSIDVPPEEEELTEQQLAADLQTPQT